MKTTTNELKTMCEDIRKELNRLYEADFTEAEIEEMQEAGEPTSLYDYFNDVLDYEFTINSDKTYKAVKIWVTLGGPISALIQITTRSVVFGELIENRLGYLQK